MTEEHQLWMRARKHAEDKAGFLVHLGVYAGINGFLALLWWLTTGPTAFPWFLLPMAGWGIGILAHFLAVFVDDGYIARTTEREYEKLRTLQLSPGPLGGRVG